MKSDECKRWIIDNVGSWRVISEWFSPEDLKKELELDSTIIAKAADTKYWKRQFKMKASTYEKEYGFLNPPTFSPKAVVREFSLEIPGTIFCEGSIRFTIAEDGGKIIHSESTGD